MSETLQPNAKALFARAGEMRADYTVFSREALKEMAEDAPDKCEFNEETGELFLLLPFSVEQLKGEAGISIGYKA